mgnify:CR=1 FL=1
MTPDEKIGQKSDKKADKNKVPRMYHIIEKHRPALEEILQKFQPITCILSDNSTMEGTVINKNIQSTKAVCKTIAGLIVDHDLKILMNIAKVGLMF